MCSVRGWLDYGYRRRDWKSCGVHVTKSPKGHTECLVSIYLSMDIGMAAPPFYTKKRRKREGKDWTYKYILDVFHYTILYTKRMDSIYLVNNRGLIGEKLFFNIHVCSKFCQLRFEACKHLRISRNFSINHELFWFIEIRLRTIWCEATVVKWQNFTFSLG